MLIILRLDYILKIMNRRIFSMAFMFAIFAALFLLFTACPSDSTGPSIYFLAKDGVTIDKKGDTTILLYTKYVDPGCYVEDNASMNENIQVTSDLETVLQIERKVASHIGEVKKTGDYTITYTAIDEAGNAGQRTKIITCKNVSDIYAGRYWTVRDDIVGQGSSDICHAARYYSNVTASANVAGRIRFSKVALHEYQGQKVSFKVDADLYSPELSSRTRSDQVGFLGTASDKEVVFYNGMSYDAAVDSMRLNYVYLQIPTQEASVAYSEGDAAINDYTVKIQGRMEGTTPKSKIVYNERGVMLYIELALNISIPNASGTGLQPIQNYVERYYPE